LEPEGTPSSFPGFYVTARGDRIPMPRSNTSNPSTNATTSNGKAWLLITEFIKEIKIIL